MDEFYNNNKLRLIQLILLLFVLMLMSNKVNANVINNIKSKTITIEKLRNIRSIIDKLQCPNKCSCLGEFIDCGNLNITSVPDQLPNWVESLELSQNRLNTEDVKNSIKNLTKLTELKIEKNLLKDIPEFEGLLQLNSLSLAQNLIVKINKNSLVTLKNLITLDLRKNYIKTITSDSFPLANRLNKLYLNGNQITEIEDGALDNLTKLQELKLGFNKITFISFNVFKHLTSLRKLELNNNELHELWTLSFQTLKKLKILRLKNNKIKKIQNDAFFGLHTISNVDLSSNNLTTLQPHYFKGLESLKELYLHNNKILYIADGVFNNTPNLELLSLNNNRISFLMDNFQPSYFDALKQLMSLTLNSNNINIIQKRTLNGLINLKILDLSNNNITTIEKESFLYLTLLDELKLTTDKLICDCNIEWFYSWLKKRNFYQITSKCGYPLWLKGKQVRELQRENLTCNDSLKPIIIDEPKSQVAIKGANLTLTCTITSKTLSSITIQWKKDNIELNKNLYIISHNKTDNLNNTLIITKLRIINAITENSGKYQCIAINEYGSTYSQKNKIAVASYPIFTKVPTNITLQSGEMARLDCAATGDPRPQIAWQKDGGHDFPAARERRMHVMPKDDAFYIINAKIFDQGVYTCTAENNVGLIQTNATLIVNERPSFIKQMENKDVIIGKSIVLECMVTGSPKPTITWLKDNQQIKNNIERYFFAADKQLLIIVDTIITDSGLYKCEINNEFGHELGIIKLTIKSPTVTPVFHFRDIMGIVVITVFCCAVGTSIIWVIIIYQAKKRNINYNNNTIFHYDCPTNINNDNSNIADTIILQTDDERTKKTEKLLQKLQETINKIDDDNENIDNIDNKHINFINNVPSSYQINSDIDTDSEHTIEALNHNINDNNDNYEKQKKNNIIGDKIINEQINITKIDVNNINNNDNIDDDNDDDDDEIIDNNDVNKLENHHNNKPLIINKNLNGIKNY